MEGSPVEADLTARGRLIIFLLTKEWLGIIGTFLQETADKQAHLYSDVFLISAMDQKRKD